MHRPRHSWTGGEDAREVKKLSEGKSLEEVCKIIYSLTNSPSYPWGRNKKAQFEPNHTTYIAYLPMYSANKEELGTYKRSRKGEQEEPKRHSFLFSAIQPPPRLFHPLATAKVACSWGKKKWGKRGEEPGRRELSSRNNNRKRGPGLRPEGPY